MEQQVFNCTEGGAFIDGMEHITLRDFMDRHALEDVDIEAVLAECQAKTAGAERCESMRTAVEEMLEGVRELRKGGARLQTVCDAGTPRFQGIG